MRLVGRRCLEDTMEGSQGTLYREARERQCSIVTGAVVRAGDREGLLARGLSRELTGRVGSLLVHRTDMPSG